MLIGDVHGSTIEGNIVRGGAGSGTLADEESSGNTLQNNDFRGNGGTDCIDNSMSADNNWVEATNLGDDANKTGLCTPGVVMD